MFQENCTISPEVYLPKVRVMYFKAALKEIIVKATGKKLTKFEVNLLEKFYQISIVPALLQVLTILQDSVGKLLKNSTENVSNKSKIKKQGKSEVQ